MTHRSAFFALLFHAAAVSALGCGDDADAVDGSVAVRDARPPSDAARLDAGRDAPADEDGAVDAAAGDSASNDADTYPFAPVAPLRAAPGLEGYGTETAAGRGGRVVIITNLNDSGPGSAREALTGGGPRQVISNVAGAVHLTTPIAVTTGTSFYGQAAPGEGLTFTMDAPASFEGTVLVEDASDVLLQHIKVRGVGSGSYRNFIVLDSSRVVVDHGSFSWSTDQNLNSWYVNEHLTFSNCLSYEGLLVDEGIAKPTLFGYTGSTGISIHHSLFAHGIGRMPMIANFDEFSVEWNVIHNPGNSATQISTQDGFDRTMRGNVTNNWYFRLQNTNPTRGEISLGGPGPISAFIDGNYYVNEDRATEGNGSFTALTERYPAPEITPGTSSVQELPESIFSHVGASLPMRDANDARVIQEVIDGGGQLIQDIRGNGGRSQTFVEPSSVDGNELIDVESVDGVPDAWKVEHGFDSGTDLTQQDSNGDGYTDWEDWRRSVFGA